LQTKEEPEPPAWQGNQGGGAKRQYGSQNGGRPMKQGRR
jgi:hypothetical protein